MFSSKKVLVVVIAAALCPIATLSAYDSDGDGVDDTLDVCCGTPVDTPVDDHGRPVGDLDRDCDVDLADFAVLQDAFTGELLACTPCDTSADCPEDQYCARLLSECQVEGTCSPRPTTCPDVWDPVCTCSGLTYASACHAAADGESVESEGECPPTDCETNAECGSTQFCEKAAGDCGGIGDCVSYPPWCMPIGGPVCGCDGVSYDYECLANLAGQSVDFEGECPPPSCQSNAECDERDYCAKSVGDCDGTGVCEQRPAGCILPENPVCGCDGNTYDDSCVAAMAGVSVEHAGQCP